MNAVDRLITIWHDSAVAFGQELEDFVNHLPSERARFWGIDLWLWLQHQRDLGLKVDYTSYRRLRGELDKLRDELLAQGVPMLSAYVPTAEQTAREQAGIRERNGISNVPLGEARTLPPVTNEIEQASDALTNTALQYWTELIRPLLRSILNSYPHHRWVAEISDMLSRVGAPQEVIRRTIDWIGIESNRYARVMHFLNDESDDATKTESTSSPDTWAQAKELYSLAIEIQNGLNELILRGTPYRLFEALRMLAERFPDLLPESLSGKEFDDLIDEIQGSLSDFLDFLETLPPEAYALIPDLIQVVLDIVGLFPGFGEVTDLISGVLALERKEWLDAALSLFSLLPLLGAVPGVAKIIRRLKAIQATVFKLARGPAREVLEQLIKILIDESGEVTLSLEWAKTFWERFRKAVRGLTDKLRRSNIRKGKRNRGAWALDDLLRGEVLEKKLGKNTPTSFPYIDQWNPATGVAVSIKTTQLLGRDLKAVEYGLRRDLRQIASFPLRINKRGYLQREDLKIFIKDIKQRVLRVGYEPGTDTPEFKQMFDRIREYAASQGLAGIEFVAVK